MWTVVYVAPTRAIAERLKTILESEGLLKLRPVGGGNGVDDRSVEVLVPESEVDEASQLIGKAWAR